MNTPFKPETLCLAEQDAVSERGWDAPSALLLHPPVEPTTGRGVKIYAPDKPEKR